jgi:uncharacterized protein YndB with AHSA1/START domain
VDPITVSTTIDLPREQVFEYLADISNHPEFTDHYLVDWRLTREDPYGAGAGARFRVKAPLNRFSWADVTFAEVQAPYKIVERGRGGKFNRIRMLGVYEVLQGPAGTTTVQYTIENEPVMPSDRLIGLGSRGWNRRQANKAMRRLRTILEEGRGRGKRATIAGL